MTHDHYRPLTAAAVLLVAAIAAVVSYLHIVTLALRFGQEPLAAYLLPLSIDGLVATSSLVMLRSARSAVSAPWLARTGLVLAVLATLGANVASGLAHGWPGALLAGWPACAFVVSAETAISMSRRQPATAPARRAQTAPAPAPAPAPGGATRARTKAAPRRAPVTEFDAESEFADVLASGAIPSKRAIRSRLRVGAPAADRLHEHLSGLVTMRS